MTPGTILLRSDNIILIYKHEKENIQFEGENFIIFKI